MKITLAQNLRKLRRDRDLTQEELAGFLGISYQAISKWERDEGYPDITMLPVLANYFGVTVDALIGNDITSREEQIQFYTDEYDRLNRNGKMDEAVELAAKAYHEYPYDWGIIDIYMRSLTRGYSEMPGEKMPELRTLCKMVVDKCPDAKIQMFAVYSMLYAEDDDKVEEWFERVPGTYDYTIGQRREDRYMERGQYDKYEHERQENMLDLFGWLLDKMSPHFTAPPHRSLDKSVIAHRTRIALFEIMFTGETLQYRLNQYAFIHLELASALFENNQKEEGYTILEKAVQYAEEWFRVPEGELCYTGMFDHIHRRKSKSLSPEKMLNFMIGNKQWSGFALVANEERYKELVERIQKYT